MDFIPDVSARSLGLALIDSGILPEQIDAVLAQIPDATERAKAKWAWGRSHMISRRDPLVLTLCGVFGLTEEQANAIFRNALKY